LQLTSEPPRELADIRSAPDAARALSHAGDTHFMLLHSAAPAGKSVLGFDPLITVSADSRDIARIETSLEMPPALPSNPLHLLEALVSQFRFPHVDPLVGWLGCLSYDVGRQVETIPAIAADDLQWPLLHFTLFRNYLVFDGSTCTSHQLRLPGESIQQLVAPMPVPRPAITANARVTEQLSRLSFESNIRRAKDYIAAGDIYQANLAQRWQVQTNLPPFEVFERLCEISPAPYAAYMRFRDDLGTRHVVSASPELFLQVANHEAITRPIKGTRPRDLTSPERDAALRDELLASDKERAELTMIVDLLRNDLGRVSQFGSVHVIHPRAIEQHPTIWHTVATIASRLRENAGLAEILAALCPGGSITGAPKIRAMQIIEELEPTRRGLYCGNIGVIGPQARSLLLSIAIRTILFHNDRAYVHAGGGIVADSDPAREYEETLHKAAAMFGALGL